MKAGVFRGARDVRVEDVPDPVITETGDAIVRMVRSSVCGSDLWPYRGMAEWQDGWRTGHELTGVVEEVGTDVRTVRPGDLVVSPFAWSCGQCEFCRAGLHTSCTRGVFPGGAVFDGCQGELVRVPMADGTLWKAPEGTPEERWDALHLLSDVLLTGYHAAKLAGVGGDGARQVVVVGDGAVGLSAVASARFLGADEVIVAGHHDDRLALARTLGATHTTAARDKELYAELLERTNGGAPAVLECVGTTGAIKTASIVARPGGVISMVGVPDHVEQWPIRRLFTKNVALRAGVAPVRAYMDEVGPAVASAEFDIAAIASDRFALHELPAAYGAMDERRALKAILLPG